MPRTKPAHAMPRPRLSRSRASHPLIAPVAPDLPASIWQMIADLLAESSPFDALLLSMTCRAARDSIREDTILWIKVLRQFEDAFWEKAKKNQRYIRPRHQPFPFVTLCTFPNFLCNGVSVSFMGTRKHGYQLPRDALPMLNDAWLLQSE